DQLRLKLDLAEIDVGRKCDRAAEQPQEQRHEHGRRHALRGPGALADERCIDPKCRAEEQQLTDDDTGQNQRIAMLACERLGLNLLERLAVELTAILAALALEIRLVMDVDAMRDL